MQTPVLASLVDIYATLQTFQFCDIQDPANPAYIPGLLEPAVLKRTLPNILAGVQADRSATCLLSNINTGFLQGGSQYGINSDGSESGYGDQPYGGRGFPTISEIQNIEDLRGKRARVRVRDISNDIDVFTVEGTIHTVRPQALAAEIEIFSRDLDAFEQLLPKQRLLDVYTAPDLATTRDTDTPVYVPFGVMRKVVLALVVKGTNFYDYGAFRKPATGTLIVNTVYRDGRVVNAVEYSLQESPVGYHVIRFTRAQTDSSGREMVIQADVTVTEFVNPANAIKFLLSDSLYGLGRAVNAASFSSAASDYTTLGLSVNGGLFQRARAFDILSFLLLHGAILDKNNAGEYLITVDTAALHIAATINLGAQDQYYNNVDLESVEQVIPPLEDQPKELVLSGLWDPGFPLNGSQGAFLLKARRAMTTANGTVTEISHPFLGDSDSLDRQAHYLWRRMLVQGNGVTGNAQLAAKALDLNHLVSFNAPALALSQTMEVRDIGLRGSRGGKGDIEAVISFALQTYSSAIFTYASAPVQAAPGASVLTDYIFTPPDAPASFSILLAGVRTGTNGHVEAVWRVEAQAPAVNVSHLVFQIFRQGETFPTQQIVRPVTVSATTQVTFVVASGLAYDLQCFARNVANKVDFQDGAVSQILNQTAPGDTTPPAQVTGLTAAIGPQRTVLLDWNDLNSPLLESYEVNRATDSGFTTNLTVFFAQLSKFIDSGLANATQYWYRVRGVSRTRTGAGARIVGPFSASATVTTARIATDDVGDDQITNAKINDLSAAKITTGLLTVNPSSSGATAIFIDNGGKMRLKTLVASPSRIIFEDSSGAEKFEITGTVSPQLDILPSTNEVGGIRLGKTGRRFVQAEINATAGIILDSTGTFVLIYGALHTDQIVTGDAALTRAGFRIPVYDEGGTFKGNIQLYD